MPYNQYEIHQLTLRVCRDSIRHGLGSISDLPKDLANSIANLYYREVCRVANENENPNFIHQEIKNEKDISIGMKKYIMARSSDITAMKNMPELVKAIRGAKLEMPQKVYNLLVETCVFTLRYRRNGLDTPWIVQKALRFFLAPIREIPGLVDLITESNEALDEADIDNLY